VRKRLLWALAVATVVSLLAACAPHATQDTLKPQGPEARTIKNLFVPVFWVAAVVFFLVEGGIVYLLVKYRHRKGVDRIPAQIHGNTRLEIGWTILPALILAGVTVPTVATIWDLAKPPPANALNVTVEGHQWWWGFQYTDPDMQNAQQKPIRIADVLVIPTGRPVYVTLESFGGGAHDDNGVSDFEVIHSFWVPELAGKQDVVPGHENHITFSADHPGFYEGQCAEFCGLSHGIMRFRVSALTPEDFATWVQLEKQNGAAPTDPEAIRGMDVFMHPLPNGMGSCVECHTIEGTAASGTAGPDLTHFAEPNHTCFAGCLLQTGSADDIKTWLTDPGAIKPGAKMPDYHLSPDEIDALVAYLQSLK